MPHLAKIGRKAFHARLLLTGMYVLLTLGGVTMVAPFMMWLSASMTSEVDSKEMQLIPAYWRRQDMLLRKYCEMQANFDYATYQLIARDEKATFLEMTPPVEASPREAADYREFLAELPPTYTVLAAAGPITATLRPRYGLLPSIEAYRGFLLDKYGSLDKVNKAYRSTETDFTRTVPPPETWWGRLFQPEFDRRFTEFLEFKQAQPPDRRFPAPAEGVWVTYLNSRIGSDVKKVNAKLGTDYPSTCAARLPSRLPDNPALAKAWEECLRSDMGLWYLRMAPAAAPAWRSFLRERYLGDISLYNRSHGTRLTRFEEIPLPDECPRDIAGMGEWNDFIARNAPIEHFRLDTPESRYRDYLRAKYLEVAAVNAAYGTKYESWDQILPPTAKVWAADCLANAGSIRWAFATRNYRTAGAYMITQGRAFLNTLLYIGLALLFTLTVNPLAAYALSRFKLPATNKILLILLATMAFPAEISMIPNFLLLKELSLLNTFWALVLPGMASGFSIFLLKGMFDGLPQDLYEAAELDGAGEVVIFWRVTMPLVKPFLAYLALGSFIGAYSAFAFAFILCPNPKMWTLMVFLQQMETWASQPVQFAGFVLASIPTLIVFITCQRVIMRGIILPTEK
ncbi:MAG: carbohydrate ABC transporter permease [Armatimonadota bacterium]